MNINDPISPIPLQLPANPVLAARANNQAAHVDSLRDASDEFEAMFVSYLLKVMRSTVEPADPEAQSLMGKDIYFQLFDNEIARSIAQTRSLGLGNMLYEQLKDREGSRSAVAPIPEVPPSIPTSSASSAPAN